MQPSLEVLLRVPALLLILPFLLPPLPLLGLPLLRQFPNLVAALLQDRHEVVDDGVLGSGGLEFELKQNSTSL